MPRIDPLAGALARLRAFALRYPEATEHAPWGECAIKVKGKVFVFLSLFEGIFRASLKLPVSAASALDMPFAEPTGYGLGKHKWVTTTFPPGQMIPFDLLEEWIDESYRAVAPKSVLAKMETGETVAQPARKAAKKRKR